MTTILIGGLATMDFVFELDQFPSDAEKYRARNATIVGGGCAATAAVTIARLGGHAQLVSTIGHDLIGDLIQQELTDQQVDCRFIERRDGYRSSFSSITVIDSGERQITNFRDSYPPIAAHILSALDKASFDAVLADTRWPQAAEALMSLAKSRGVAGVLDAEEPVRLAQGALDSASHIVFSATGLRDYTDCADLVEGLHRAFHETGVWVAVTDGKNGVHYWNDGNVVTVPAFAVEVVDTLGAGDVWHGAFALALAEQHPIAAAVSFSNAVAALKCTAAGGRAGIPDRETATSLHDTGRV